jgi:ABC-type polysaccharide/polyol phosphate transport system ATPase subunit
MMEVPIEYGFDRPMRVAALIQFANPFNENGTLEENVELFGFYLQVPTKKQIKKRLLDENYF